MEFRSDNRLDYKQRLQRRFFLKGSRSTVLMKEWLAESKPAASVGRRLVTLTFASWNQLDAWLRQIDVLRWVA